MTDKKMTSPQEETVMSEDNALENMIDYAANNDFNKANAIFNDMIAQKMDAAIDQEKIAVANQIFNDVDEEELEAEADADAEEAARYPLREVSRRGLVTSGPLARECTTISIFP